MKRFLLAALKLGLSVAIVAYLAWNAVYGKGHANVFAALLDEPKDWSLLLTAFFILLATNLLTLTRWWLLMRALSIPCGVSEAIRAGFWGLLFNLAPLGVVSGDVARAYLVARGQQGNHARVVASVLVDRVIGVYLLFVFATAAILLTNYWKTDIPEIAWLCRLVFLITGVGGVAITAILVPGITRGTGIHLLGALPRIGHAIVNVIHAVRMYRHRLPVLALCAAATLVIHGLSTISCYLIACSLPWQVVSLADHLVIIPLSIASSMLPLSFGPFEFTLEFLYTHLPQGTAAATGQGLIVALAYRIMSILIPLLGVACYFGRRREVTEMKPEAVQG